MKESRLSMNRILVVTLVLSAIALLIIVKLTKTAGTLWPVNEYFGIEDSEYAVRYSNLEHNGIYKGEENNNTLVLKGNFSFGSDCALDGNIFYTNEYKATDMGIVLCKAVSVNLDTAEKKTVLDNAAIIGKCASGELVLTDSFAYVKNNPEENALCQLYFFSSRINMQKGFNVLYYDIQKGEVVYSTPGKTDNETAFEKVYLNRTLAEVRK